MFALLVEIVSGGKHGTGMSLSLALHLLKVKPQLQLGTRVGLITITSHVEQEQLFVNLCSVMVLHTI